MLQSGEGSSLDRLVAYQMSSHEVPKRPAIGVAVFLQCEDDILLGRRLGSHGSGAFSIPGGHQEWGQSPEEAAVEEVKQETSLMVSVYESDFVGYTNDLMLEEGKHYITLYFRVRLMNRRQTQVLEPDKFVDHIWVPILEVHNMNLFAPLRNFFTKYGAESLVRTP